MDTSRPVAAPWEMARPPHQPLPPVPAAPAPKAEAQDWALLALLALGEHELRAERLLEGAKVLLPELGLPCPPDEPALLERLKACHAQGLVQLERWGTARCSPDLREKVLLLAWRQGWAEALGRAYRALNGTFEFTGYPSIHRFRLALHTGAFSEFLALADVWGEPRMSPQGLLETIAAALPRAPDPAWLHHLPPAVGHLVARAMLDSALLNWEPLAPIAAWLESHPALDLEYRMLLGETLLYLGRYPQAEAVARQTRPGPEASWPPRLAGLQAFWQERDDLGLAGFELAWEAVKAANKRIRMPLLPGPAGWFHALALIRAGQADRAERMARVYGGRNFLDRHSRVWDGLLDLALLTQGRKLLERHLDLPSRLQEGPLLSFLHLLITYWIDAPGFRAGKLDTFLAALGRTADQFGAPWFQTQVETLEARWRGVPGEGRTLVDLQEGTPSWQRTLDALGRLGQAPSSGKAAKVAKPRRLAWVAWIHHGPAGYEDWRLEAREQRQGKGGEWGVGRSIPLHKVRSASVAMDFLGPEDRKAIEATTDRPYLNRADLWRILHALAGHEALFLEGRDGLEPLEVRRGEPQLRVRAEDDGLRLELEPAFDGDPYKVVEEAPGRLTAYAFTLRHREISGLLGSQGLTVPPSARDLVARAVASMASHVAIHSELSLDTLGMGLEEVAADATPELDLRPWGEGLRVQLRVRPMAGGPALPPGEGARELILEVAGRRCRTQRDLSLELSLASAVMEACPTLAGGGWAWELDEPMDCLGLMLEVEQVKDQVRLAWPEGERFKPPQRASASRLSLGLKGESQWFTLEGHLQLDEGRIIPIRELLDLLARAKGEFVPLGEGLWVRLERHFRDRLEGLRALAVPHGAGLRLAPAAALGLEELTREAGQFTAPKAWKERASAIRRAFTGGIAVPVTLQAVLRPYQEDGFRWLSRLAEAGLGACLADDMGLGKTLQALALLLRRAGRGPALVVAPTSVVGNWAVETRRFAPSLEVRVFGEGDRMAALESAGPGCLVLCTYGLLVQEQERLTAKSWDTVILDEAQAIKNADTQRSQAVMALKAEARLVMSGTPVENHLGELWNLFRFLNPGLLGSAEHFTRTFALPIARDHDRASLQRLKRILNPFLLRRTKQEVLEELPPLTEIVHEVVLSAEERAFYEVLRRRALEHLSTQAAPGQGHIQILAELMRLRRACCHPRLVEPGLALGSSKLAAFVDILAELRENRHRALVFSQFVDHLTVIREHLDQAGINYQYLDGSTPAPERRKRIDAFQAGEGDLFLISLKAGGTGLNLTAADYVIHMDPWWNPAVEDQASGRAHRIGQDRPVTVYRLVAKDTIEEKILALHGQKRTLAEGVLEGAGTVAALSVEDLMALLQG